MKKIECKFDAIIIKQKIQWNIIDPMLYELCRKNSYRMRAWVRRTLVEMFSRRVQNITDHIPL